MLKNRSRRNGMTLPEVLVTVAIVAVLAAIVVPTVTNQIGKGDDTNLSSNVESLRTAITAFVSDVRKFPGRLQNLTTQPANNDLDIDGAQFGAGPAGRWHGPYNSTSLKTYTAGSAARTDSTFIGLAYAIDSLSAVSGHVQVLLGGVTSTAAARHIDSLIDGATGNAAGNLTYTEPPTNNRLQLLLMGK